MSGRERPDGERLSGASLDAERRARMRRRVLASLRPRPPSFADRAYVGLSLLARPAPAIARLAAIALVVASLAAATGVAAADSLPDEPLYPVKLATEQLRLALATTPEDRATVELSLAEHRLSEAERLAVDGREEAAFEASSAYGNHLASAAAELASSEGAPARAGALVDQLESRLAAQRESVASTAERLARDPRTAPAAAALATVRNTEPPVSGASTAARIAANAAAFADRVAIAAEAWAKANDARRVPSSSAPATARPTATPTAPAIAASPRPSASPTSTPRATATPRGTNTPTPTPTSTSTPTPTPVQTTPQATRSVNPSAAARAADRARLAAEQARKAAQRASEATKKPVTARPTVAPRPTITPRPTAAPAAR